MEQITMFDLMYETYKVDKPVRLIELFAGVGSQAMALKVLGVPFEHYLICEWEAHATASYKQIHMEHDNTDYSADLTDEQLIDILSNLGISVDGKNPLSRKQIAGHSYGEQWRRECYNNFKATHNLVNIMAAKGADLGIVDTDKFVYLLTYSFPCQDLSLAGKMKGMSKGSGTRSGLLWEVERLLNETENLPQILLMENVPQVVSDQNIDDFHSWCGFLESKGYKCYTQVLNAKDYGVAQNRERCFMVSILGDYNYKFPQPVPLDKTMKDYLEPEVEEKYYINSAKAQQLVEDLKNSGQLERAFQKPKAEERVVYVPKETLDITDDANTIPERERENRPALTLLSTSLEQSTPQTVSKQDMTQESAISNQTEQVLLKKIEILGHLGVGGQKGYIYKSDALSPCLPVTQYKDPTKILE